MTTHAYTITFKSWNRTAGRMSGPHRTTVAAQSRFGALRTWWSVQRQFQPLVTIQSMRLNHSRCPKIELPTHWEHNCPLAHVID